MHERIHIVHLVTSLEPGGLENGVVNLALGLDPDRFMTSIVCLERFGAFSERLTENVEVICLEKTAGFRWLAVTELAAKLQRLRPDILHTHNLGPLTYGVLAKLRLKHKVDLIQGEHAQLRADEKTLKRLSMRRMGYFACKAIHTVSSGLQRELVELGFAESKIRAILNGVDCVRFYPGDRKNKSGKDKFIIGIVGRFGAMKGHMKLLKAFERIASEYPHVQLMIVGDGGPAKTEVLETIATSDFGDQVEWVGFQKDPSSFYRKMDLLAIPSENEGLSNAMLEAMASGVPCLAHPACGAAEVIRDGENGYLRDLSTSERLALELKKIISLPSLVEKCGTDARKTAASDFSIQAMIQSYENLYLEVGQCQG